MNPNRLGAGWLIAILLSIFVHPQPAAGQAGITPEQLGRIVARFIDADTGAPIDGVFVELATMNRRALSDATGTVFFLDVPPGTHTLVVQHIAYGSQSVEVRVEGLQSSIVGIELSQQPLAVAPLEVLIEFRPRYLEEKGFYDRRVVGHGTFFDPQFVERWSQGAQRGADGFIDLLLNISPALAGANLGRRASGGSSGFSSIQCPQAKPAVYIDGQPLLDDDGQLGGRPSTALEMLSTEHIGAVEVYPSSHGVPDHALRSEIGCGSVIIWTNRWRGGTRELDEEEIILCEPATEDAPVIEGIVRDEYTGVLLPGAHVVVTSFPVDRPRSTTTTEVVANGDARYRVCEVPPDHTVTLRVETADKKGTEHAVLAGSAAPGSRTIARDLTIRVAGPGDIAGRVIDRDTGRPVAAADIAVLGEGSRTQSDGQGFFTLEDVLPGDQMVQITHLGFEEMNEVVSIVADRTVDLRIEMSADPIELAPLIITVLRDRRLEMRGFYERRTQGQRTGLGHYLDDADIERLASAQTSSVLRIVPGVRVRCEGSRDCTIQSIRASGCARMNLYINGTLALGETRRDPIFVDDLVHPSEIAGLEVYAGGASVPAEYSGSSGRCGAVVIWTK